MALPHKGLVKLSEECGELIQVASKLVSYPELQTSWTDEHPDGTILLDRLQEEVADVLAAITLIRQTLVLSDTPIDDRKLYKLKLFRRWMAEP